MKFYNIIGPQIRKLRYNLNMSQPQLAVKLQLAGWDISRSKLAKIEAKIIKVADHEMLFFTRIFRVGIQELYPPINPKEPLHESITKLLETRKCK